MLEREDVPEEIKDKIMDRMSAKHMKRYEQMKKIKKLEKCIENFYIQ